MQYIDNFYDKHANAGLERSPDTINNGNNLSRSPPCRGAPSRPDTTVVSRDVSDSITPSVTVYKQGGEGICLGGSPIP
jgi:hypothetical protein